MQKYLRFLCNCQGEGHSREKKRTKVSRKKFATNGVKYFMYCFTSYIFVFHLIFFYFLT